MPKTRLEPARQGLARACRIMTGENPCATFRLCRRNEAGWGFFDQFLIVSDN